MRVLLIAIFVVILLVNFFINSANLFKIVRHSFQTNSIDNYWDLFFKNCLSGRAIISSILGFIIAFFVFCIIAPIVLIRKSIYCKKLTLKEDNYPVYFIYDDFHETQFQNIRHRLVDNGFKNPIYFSALKYSSVD